MVIEYRSPRTFARICALAAFAIVAIAGFAQSASAKGEMQAILERPVPADAKPGSILAVSWTLQVKRGGGPEPLGADQVPFGAGQVYFRLVGRDQRQTSESVVDGTGSFSARVKVPPSGVERVEIGIVGERISDGREGVRSDIPIPIIGRSLDQSRTESAQSVTRSSAVWIGLVGGIALIALAGFVARRRRLPTIAAAR